MALKLQSAKQYVNINILFIACCMAVLNLILFLRSQHNALISFALL
ncbi:hypothetical protein LMANV2_170014 [Leptospira interrogans serovar Manilae]|uniref:Lipoprotein n=1 Tax=Leptospira interrogans serovar Manilae TaxID=214675 RepID=A0AAQ1SMS5_LEPIR|nr:hypothetical protein LMANV2_170014 [Leptospira interrogans serovar Manilae]